MRALHGCDTWPTWNHTATRGASLGVTPTYFTLIIIAMKACVKLQATLCHASEMTANGTVEYDGTQSQQDQQVNRR